MPDNFLAALGIKIDSTTAKAGANEVNRELSGLEAKAEKTADVMREGFQGAGRAISALGPIIGAVTTAFAAGSIVAVGSEFAAAVSELSAITGATGEDLEFLSNRAREFGASTTKTAAEAVEAFKLIASAKPDLLTSRDALAAVAGEVISLAGAAGISLPEAAGTLGLALNQFGASADQASRFINVLAAGAKFGASEIVETAAAIQQSGVAATSAGTGFEELNAAIQVLAASGLRGSEAGTPLRNILLKLQLETDKFNPKVVGLAKALENLGAANLSAEEKLKKFSLENINAAEILIRNVGTLRQMTDSITGTGIAYEQAAVRTDNLRGDMARLGSTIEELQISIFEQFNPALRSIVQTTSSVVDGITSVIKEFRAFNVFAVGNVLITIQDLRVAFVEFAAFLNTKMAGAIDFLTEKYRNFALFASEFVRNIPGGGLFGFDLEDEADKMEAWARTIEGNGAVAIREWESLVAQTRIEAMRSREEIEKYRDELLESIFVGATKPPTTGGAAEEITKIGDSAESASKKVEKLTKAQKEAARVAEQELAARQAEAARIIESTLTPYERFIREQGKMIALHKEGLLPTENYLRAIGRLRNEMFDAGVATEDFSEKTLQALQQIQSSVEGFGREVEDVFVNMATGVETSFQDLANSVIASITRIVTRMLVIQPIVEQITSSLNEVRTSGGGGFLGNLLSNFGFSFGDPFAAFKVDPFPGTFGRQHGGPVSPGQAYVVGEQGPELLIPSSSGTVVPNNRLGGMVINNNFTINAPSGTISRQTEAQIALAASNGVSRASRRNG